jgi:lysine-ketoglutarate reductase/saccharopine dehydrogenase-like protein (TIGR00300 family)
MKNSRLLVCPPHHFDVTYAINPWMRDNIGRVDHELAYKEWEYFVEILRELTEVEQLKPPPGLHDLVFVANAGLMHGNRFIPSNFACVQRRPEVPFMMEWFANHGYMTVPLENQSYFEGSGDALWQPGRSVLWAGYGIRSSLQVYREIAERCSIEVRPLRLIDQWFYHLDTCFLPLVDDRLVYFPDAFDHDSLCRIRESCPAHNRIEIEEEDARQFACNAVVVGDVVVVNGMSENLQRKLAKWHYEVRISPLSQFLRAGGAARCLSLELDHESDPNSSTKSDICSDTVEFDGQLLDSGGLNRALDAIVSEGASFEIQTLRPGLRSDQESSATMIVTSTNAEKLDSTLTALVDLGARISSTAADARLESAVDDGVAPDGFYCTTIYPTQIRVLGKWLAPSHRRMDAVFVVSPERDSVHSLLLREIKKGDLVVCGADGIQVDTPLTSRKNDGFEFMSSSVSSERRVEVAIQEIARDMERVRERNGRIVVVAGPVVVHTGGAQHLSALIREGFVDALLGGNAIATHDIEYALFGTSLGMDLTRNLTVEGGHRHHLRAINLVRRHGSIAEAVNAGEIQSGVMYECVQHGIPYSLAGSIRDDGPLPDTQMDLLKAQAEYSELVQGADIILMLSSMLHSIGVGNMTPSGTKLICVDISQAVVTKLADRGSVESIGIVTDVGLFLNLLHSRLVEEQHPETNSIQDTN